MVEHSSNILTVPLTNGGEALVDADDYERITAHRWSRSHYGYAIRYIGRDVCWMHREVMRAPDGFEVDHKFGDKLDNRKENLRLASHQQNCWNNRMKKSPTGGYPGVGFHKKSGKWRAHIGVNQRHIHIGLFLTQDEALQARRRAEEEYYGEFSPSRPEGAST